MSATTADITLESLIEAHARLEAAHSPAADTAWRALHEYQPASDAEDDRLVRYLGEVMIRRIWNRRVTS